MSGSGATVLLSGATGTQTASNEITHLKQREFVNEGTFSFTNGQMELAEGAVLRNTGTFNSNTGYSAAIIAGSGSSSIVNTGTFQKTSNIANTIEPGFENKGAVTGEANTLAFSGGGSSRTGALWQGKGSGQVKFSSGTFVLSGGSFSGSVDFGGSSTTISLEGADFSSTKLDIGEATLNVAAGTSTVGELAMHSGMELTGPGTLEISKEPIGKQRARCPEAAQR